MQNTGILEAGLTFESAEFSDTSNTQSDLRYTSPGVYFKAGFDTLDRRSFPTRGERLTLSITLWEEDASGDFIDGGETTDEPYHSTQLQADWKAAISEGNHSLIGKASFAYLDSETDQSIHYVELGGFLNLSGFHRNALPGNHKLLGLIAYQYDLGKSLLGLTGFPIYIGASIETGNVWMASENIEIDNLISAGSIFLSTDSKLGPIALGLGFAEDNNDSIYFYLGKNI